METKIILSPDEKVKHWGEGEWVNEPDYITFEHLGYKLEIVRLIRKFPDMIFGGHLCGYITIPEGHPWFGFNWEKAWSDDSLDIDVHGGLTYYAPTESTAEWKLGFDCAHSGDITPSMIKFDKKWNESEMGKSFASLEKEMKEKNPNCWLFHKVYRNIHFCIEETKSLAEQAKKAEISCTKT